MFGRLRVCCIPPQITIINNPLLGFHQSGGPELGFQERYPACGGWQWLYIQSIFRVRNHPMGDVIQIYRSYYINHRPGIQCIDIYKKKKRNPSSECLLERFDIWNGTLGTAHLLLGRYPMVPQAVIMAPRPALLQNVPYTEPGYINCHSRGVDNIARCAIHSITLKQSAYVALRIRLFTRGILGFNTDHFGSVLVMKTCWINLWQINIRQNNLWIKGIGQKRSLICKID